MKMYPEILLIPNEEIEQFPQMSFPGEIHVIETKEDIKKGISYLKNCTELGFDTETRPSFKKGLSYPLSLLQLCDDTHAFLFRIQKTGLPKELLAILSSKKIIKVGAAIHDDIIALKKVEKFKSTQFIDLQTMAKKLLIENFGLKKLTPLVLGFRISKRQQLSNWDYETLTDAQKSYAATDAWVSLLIYKKLLPYYNDTINSETGQRVEP